MAAYPAEPDASAAPTDLPTLAQSGRQVAARATRLRAERHLGTRWTEPCRLAFDESTDGARRYHESDEHKHKGAVTLAQAVADRPAWPPPIGTTGQPWTT